VQGALVESTAGAADPRERLRATLSPMRTPH